MSTVDSKTGKLVFRSLCLHYKDRKPTTIKNVLEWKWVDGEITGKQVGDIYFKQSDENIENVKEVKEIIYREQKTPANVGL